MQLDETNALPIGPELENELTKLRLAARFGTVLTADQALPPSLEAQWLSTLEAVESAFAGASQTTVEAYLGYPRYPREARLSDRRLAQELDRLRSNLDAAGIHFSTLYRVPPREMYRYLTGEFMKEPIEDLRMEGINQQFVYEEFFPNDEFEVEHTLAEFFDMLFGRYYAMLESVIYIAHGELRDSPEMLAMVNRLCDFAESFDEIELDDFDLEELVMISKDWAEARVQVRYTGYPNKKGKAFTFNGPARFSLRVDRYGYWAIEKVEMPGVYDPGAAA
jgi:hypothetical protein